MERASYRARGRRVEVVRLRSARVVPLSDEREVVAVPGWRPLPIGNQRFQLLLHADAVPERAVRMPRLEELVPLITEAERRIDAQPLTEEERTLRSELGTSGVPVLLGSDGGLLIPTGEVVARFPDGMDLPAIEREVKARRAEVLRKLSFSPNTYVLRAEAGADGLDLANALVDAGVAEFASPNFIEEMPFRSLPLPPNPLFAHQWHLHHQAQARADVRALEAWQITLGSPEIVICILDSGIDSRHEAFSSPGKLVPGFDFDDNDAFPDPTNSSHGTSCAGVAAAPWGIGRVVGVAPACRLMAIRRASLSEHLKMAEAFAWAADHGADIISCSFGYDNRPWILPDMVRAALDYAVSSGRGGKGCVLVWAAGNGNEGISTDEWASYEKVIAVAASTDQNRRAPYSDFGPEVDICAPSNGGTNGITTTAIGGYTHHFGGTSSAAPLVAGIAALLLSVNPSLDWTEVRDLLRQSADKIDGAGGSYDAAGHSHLYGYGRVNALRALHAISVLAEAARGSDLAPRLPLVRAFADGVLASRPAGREILGILEGWKFRILDLLHSSPSFRPSVVLILHAAADVQEALSRGEAPEVSEAVWGAIAAVTPLLVEARDRAA